MYSLKAVITVEYGKEFQAALNIGDTIYSYDESVKVAASRYGGVLLLYSKLTFEEIVKLLRSTHQPYVKRILKVDKCCRESIDDVSRCIFELVEMHGKNISYIRIYERGPIKKVSRELINKVKEVLSRSSQPGKILHIIPIDYVVCLGVMNYGEEFLRIRKSVNSLK